MSCPSSNQFTITHTLAPLDGWVNVSGLWAAGHLNTFNFTATSITTPTFNATTIFKKGDKIKVVSLGGKTSYAFLTNVTAGAITYISLGFLPNPGAFPTDIVSEVWLSKHSNPSGWPSFFYYDAITSGRVINPASGNVPSRFNISEGNCVDMWCHSSNFTLAVASALIQIRYPVGISPTNITSQPFPYCDVSGAGTIIQNGPFVVMPACMFNFLALVVDINKSDLSSWPAGVPLLFHYYCKIPI